VLRLLVQVGKYLMIKAGELFDEDMAQETAEFDWTNETGGREVLAYDAFFTFVFEISEMWAGTLEAPDYIEFLTDLNSKLEAKRQREGADEPSRGRRLLQ
jgi:hypothetical protein